MGLEIPDLDDREYAAILEDALKQIPVRSEEWTDHNVHDPGRTILEMLSWVAETHGYQLDQVTDAHVEKYLKLMGVRPRPPEPATVLLELRAPEGMEGEEIPESEPVAVEDRSGFSGTFETTKPVTLTRTAVERVVSTHADGRTDNSTANGTHGMHFLAFGERAERGSAMYVGLDNDPFAFADIIDLTVNYHDAALPEPTAHEADDPAFEPSVELAWEYCTDYEAWHLNDRWNAFEIRRDQTDRLYGGGTVALERPADETEAWSLERGQLLDRSNEYYWIRCRVRESGYEVPPAIEALGLDVVPAQHRSTAEDAVLRRADGGTETTAQPEQTFLFDRSPILEATITVGGDRWKEVTDFDASEPADEHYVLDRSDGAVRFGNGVRGAVPEAGQQVKATTYAYGGGNSGNVQRSASCQFDTDEFADVRVSPASNAAGGADAESVEAALVRLRRDLETPYRAVSPDDHRRVAMQTPGLRFGRASTFVGSGEGTAESRKSSGVGTTDLNGVGSGESPVVTVVVVPFSTLPEPVPSEGFLNAVRRHLERHRLLGERVQVAPPEYVGIGVDVEIGIGRTYSANERRRAVVTAIDEFLDPLDGFDGEGWPFGRPVYISELYEVIDDVEGVKFSTNVSIRPLGECETDERGNVLLPDAGLPYPETHTVTVEVGRSS